MVNSYDFFKTYLPEQIKKSIDMQSIKPYPTHFVSKNDRSFITDAVFNARFNNKQGYLVILAEHQSRPEKLMPVRILEYTLEIIRHHTDTTKSKKIPLVYPIVIYQNSEPYPYSNDICDLVDAPSELVDQYFLKPFILVDLAKEPFDRFINETSLFNLVALALKNTFAKKPIDLKSFLTISAKFDPQGVHQATEIVLEYTFSMLKRHLPTEKHLSEILEKLYLLTPFSFIFTRTFRFGDKNSENIFEKAQCMSYT